MQYYTIAEADFKFKNQIHPREDYFSISTKYPIFVVADGVTLNFKKLAENNIQYPDPSPAGEVAKIFCEAVMRSGDDKYDRFDADDIVKVFKEANNQVNKYNQQVGKSDISGNITGFYAAASAFVIIKNYKAHWASICDSFVAHFDKEMNWKFMSSGLCTPYAVVNGEERMTEHLEKGVFVFEKDDRIFIFTDGFENYFSRSEFLNLLADWPVSLEQEIKKLTRDYVKQDPEQYGHERTLIATKT